MMIPAHLAQRLVNRPIALAPNHIEIVVASISAAVGQNPGMLESTDPMQGTVTPKVGYDVLAGIAIIRVSGYLCQMSGLIPRGYYSWYFTGYNTLRQCILLAVQDPEVRAIALDIDSPGGDVAGCFDLCDQIYAVRGSKPIWAILNESAYSAAYAIASACDYICVPRTGGVGSVGVISIHADYSSLLSKEGIKITVMTYGDRKADGHPTLALSREAQKRFQSDLDVMGDLFVETVARNRKVTAAKIRATEAATFLGSEGVDAGLADVVLAPDAAFRALVKKLG